MRHVDELTMMMFVDEELTEAERDEVAAHLSSCPECQRSHSYWLSDQSWFMRTFQEPADPSPIHLNDLVWAQIEAIASIHKRRHRVASGKTERLWAALAAALLLGVLFLFLQAGRWLERVGTPGGSDDLWALAFWLKEHIPRLWLYPLQNTAEIAALFLLLLAGLITLNARNSSNRRGDTEGGLDL